jgi:hypothetical protein
LRRAVGRRRFLREHVGDDAEGCRCEVALRERALDGASQVALDRHVVRARGNAKRDEHEQRTRVHRATIKLASCENP